VACVNVNLCRTTISHAEDDSCLAHVSVAAHYGQSQGIHNVNRPTRSQSQKFIRTNSSIPNSDPGPINTIDGFKACYDTPLLVMTIKRGITGFCGKIWVMADEKRTDPTHLGAV